jgi:hypothetical protein
MYRTPASLAQWWSGCEEHRERGRGGEGGVSVRAKDALEAHIAAALTLCTRTK